MVTGVPSVCHELDEKVIDDRTFSESFLDLSQIGHFREPVVLTFVCLEGDILGNTGLPFLNAEIDLEQCGIFSQT